LDPDPSLFFSSVLDTNLVFGIVVIFVLLLCSAVVSGAKVALFSLSQKDIDEILQEQNAKGKMISTLLEKPKKLEATLLVATNFITIGVVLLFFFIANNFFTYSLSPIFIFCIKVFFVAFLILLFGEILPKIYASSNTSKFAKLIANPIAILDKLLSPISLPMRSLTVYLPTKLGKQKSNFSVDQLSQALEMTDYEDSSSEEQKILEGIVTFGNTDTKQVMSPRMDIFAIEIEEPFQVIYSKIVEKGYSRIPVFRDNIDQIEGVLFVKDLLRHIDKKDFDWKTLIREPFFVPENKKLDNLLKDFQSMKSHLAIVVDEYGGTSGLISLEDIIEEIVGDIDDEDSSKNDKLIKIYEEGKIAIVDAKINLLDLNEEFDYNFK
jgi:gliding motility-associated protein GldE